MNWPNDADGDVLRSLDEQGFDFAMDRVIDFVVDFDTWPPPARALSLFGSEYTGFELVEPTGVEAGHVLLQIAGRVSYDFVTSMQRKLSIAFHPYGGRCESWGVLSD